MLFLVYRNNVRRVFKIITITVAVIGISFPVWYPYTENVRMKQEANLKAGGSFQSRETLWRDRIAEFKENPMLGSGFASINKEVIKAKLLELGIDSVLVQAQDKGALDYTIRARIEAAVARGL